MLTVTHWNVTVVCCTAATSLTTRCLLRGLFKKCLHLKSLAIKMKKFTGNLSTPVSLTLESNFTSKKGLKTDAHTWAVNYSTSESFRTTEIKEPEGKHFRHFRLRRVSMKIYNHSTPQLQHKKRAENVIECPYQCFNKPCFCGYWNVNFTSFSCVTKYSYFFNHSCKNHPSKGEWINKMW